MKLLLAVPQAAAEPVPKTEPKVFIGLLARRGRLLVSTLRASASRLTLPEHRSEAVVTSLCMIARQLLTASS